MIPANVFGMNGEALDASGACIHTHDKNCGYAEGEAGIDCSHTGENACGTKVEKQEEIPCDKECAVINENGETNHLEDCAYSPAVEGKDAEECDHTEGCGYAPTVDGSACTHVCGIECGVTQEPTEPKQRDVH